MADEKQLALANNGNPLTRGLTVNVAPEGDGYRLQVWRERLPLCSEHHDNPRSVLARLGGLFATGLMGAAAADFVDRLRNG